jgi:hypothetical protein
MTRNRTAIALSILVLIGLGIFFWQKTKLDRVSAPVTTQSSPPPESQGKIEMTKEGLPAPAAPGMVPQDYKPYGEASLLELFMTPIEFYGKVVDENGNPIAGATAKMSVSDEPITDGAKYTKTTDGGGLFSLTGLTGAAVSVNVTMQGYYSTEQSRGMIRFGKFRSNSDPQIPTATSPTVFVLRKVGETVPLVRVTERPIKVPKDGSPVQVDLATGQTTQQGDLTVQCWTNDQAKNADGQYEWKCLLTAPGGGLIERTDPMAFEAPSEGYKPSVELGPSAEKWSSRAEREYFVRLSDNRYARISFRMRTGGEHFFVIESFLNPTPGNRNLEFDPAKAVP